jgi:3-oxoacyl-[acyl-carrier-protein] synthase-1
VPAWLGRHAIGARLQAWIEKTYSSRFSSVSLLSDGATIALYEVAKALKELQEEDGGALVVGALDSFMDAELLDLLAVNGRLFSRGNPHGLIPAEAAVLVMLASPGVHRQAPPTIGTVRSVFTGFEQEDLLTPNGVIGRGLAKPLRQAFETFSPARFLVDLNGERWRSEDLGFALSGARVSDELLADFETPIAFTGDCGAANSLIMATVAMGAGQAGAPDKAEDHAADVSILSIALPQGPRCVAVLQSQNKQGVDA